MPAFARLRRQASMTMRRSVCVTSAQTGSMFCRDCESTVQAAPGLRRIENQRPAPAHSERKRHEQITRRRLTVRAYQGERDIPRSLPCTAQRPKRTARVPRQQRRNAPDRLTLPVPDSWRERLFLGGGQETGGLWPYESAGRRPRERVRAAWRCPPRVAAAGHWRAGDGSGEQRIRGALPATRTCIVHIGVNADLKHKGTSRLLQNGLPPARYFYDMERRLTRGRRLLDSAGPRARGDGHRRWPSQQRLTRRVAGSRTMPFAASGATWSPALSSGSNGSAHLSYRPELWQVAWDVAQGRVAGTVPGHHRRRAERARGPKRGWIDALGVCPAYRKRGLGRAVLLSGLGRPADGPGPNGAC